MKRKPKKAVRSSVLLGSLVALAVISSTSFLALQGEQIGSGSNFFGAYLPRFEVSSDDLSRKHRRLDFHGIPLSTVHSEGALAMEFLRVPVQGSSTFSPEGEKVSGTDVSRSREQLLKSLLRQQYALLDDKHHLSGFVADSEVFSVDESSVQEGEKAVSFHYRLEGSLGFARVAFEDVYTYLELEHSLSRKELQEKGYAVAGFSVVSVSNNEYEGNLSLIAEASGSADILTAE